MNRNRTPPGTGLLLSLAAAMGLVRAMEGVAEEARSSQERIDPKTLCAPDAIDVRLVARIGLAVILVLWVIVVLVYPLFRYFVYDRVGGQEPSRALVYQPDLPPRSRNVNHPYQVLERQRKMEDGQLSGYYWVDRGKAVVAIPIERAMGIIATRGVPVSPAPKDSDSKEYYSPRQSSMRTGFEGKVVSEPQ